MCCASLVPNKLAPLKLHFIAPAFLRFEAWPQPMQVMLKLAKGEILVLGEATAPNKACDQDRKNSDSSKLSWKPCKADDL